MQWVVELTFGGVVVPSRFLRFVGSYISLRWWGWDLHHQFPAPFFLYSLQKEIQGYALIFGQRSARPVAHQRWWPVHAGAGIGLAHGGQQDHGRRCAYDHERPKGHIGFAVTAPSQQYDHTPQASQKERREAPPQ